MEMIHQNDQDDSDFNPFPLFGYFSQFLFIITSILWNFFAEKYYFGENCEIKKSQIWKTQNVPSGVFIWEFLPEFSWIPFNNFPIPPPQFFLVMIFGLNLPVGLGLVF